MLCIYVLYPCARMAYVLYLCPVSLCKYDTLCSVFVCQCVFACVSMTLYALYLCVLVFLPAYECTLSVFRSRVPPVHLA